MSTLFEKLCRSSPLNIPGSGYDIFEWSFEETQCASLLDDVYIPVVKSKKASKRNFEYHPDGYIVLTPERLEEIENQPKLSEDTCLSFDEWRSSGYYIIKGSKSQFRDALGIPQFTIEQVNKKDYEVY